MAIRITDVALTKYPKQYHLTLKCAHGTVKLSSLGQIQLALGHTGITLIPHATLTQAYLRDFLIGRIARIDKKYCKKSSYDTIIAEQKITYTLTWKRKARHAA